MCFKSGGQGFLLFSLVKFKGGLSYWVCCLDKKPSFIQMRIFFFLKLFAKDVEKIELGNWSTSRKTFCSHHIEKQVNCLLVVRLCEQGVLVDNLSKVYIKDLI